MQTYLAEPLPQVGGPGWVGLGLSNTVLASKTAFTAAATYIWMS